jgi:hypothetical protein
MTLLEYTSEKLSITNNITDAMIETKQSKFLMKLQIIEKYKNICFWGVGRDRGVEIDEILNKQFS